MYVGCYLFIFMFVYLLGNKRSFFSNRRISGSLATVVVCIGDLLLTYVQHCYRVEGDILGGIACCVHIIYTNFLFFSFNPLFVVVVFFLYAAAVPRYSLNCWFGVKY